MFFNIYKWKILFIAFLYINLSQADESDEMDLPAIIKKANIVPDVIAEAPKNLIEVTYPSGVKVQKGNELTPTNVKDIPHVVWESEPNSFYTLIMTDPDAPSRTNPKFREFRHWLVANIPGNNVSEGDTIFEYVGSGPPKNTGLHRYIFLLYKQDGKLTITDEKVTNRSRKNRPSSSAKKFAKQYNLGNPIAINFYQAQYDDYVPTVHKQLSAS